jgi:hypothetical protein
MLSALPKVTTDWMFLPIYLEPDSKFK